MKVEVGLEVERNFGWMDGVERALVRKDMSVAVAKERAMDGCE